MTGDWTIVYVAEIARRIKSRPFIVGLLVGVLGITFLTKLPAFLNRTITSSNAVVLVGSASLTARAKPLLANDDYRILATLPEQPVDDALLKSRHASAAIALESATSGLRVTVYAHDPGSVRENALRQGLLPLQLELATHRSAAAVKNLSAIPITIEAIASKFTSAGQASAARGIAYTLLIFLYLLILLNSTLVINSVAEEKSSRIAELLIASVNPTALLTGKIFASATLGFLQLAVFVAAAIYLGGDTGATNSAHAQAATNNEQLFSLSSALDVITPGIIIAFLAYFLIGFLQLSTLFAGAASLINRTEDLGSITFPLVLPVVAAFLIAMVALEAPDAPLVIFTSYIPLLAPFVMFARIAVSNVPLWQVGLSLAINLAALYGIAVLAGKIYRVGMLLYGRAPSLRQVWSVIRS
jgi:ABC-2 type transport system permease protein